MESKARYRLPLFFLAVDLLILTGIYFLSANIWVQAWDQETFIFQTFLWLVPFAWMIISFLMNVYNDRRIQSGRSWNIRKITISFGLLIGIILLVVVFGKFKLSRTALSLYLLLDLFALLASGWLRNKFLGLIRSLGYSPRRVVFLGSDSEIETLKSWVSQHPEQGFQQAHYLEYTEFESRESILNRIRVYNENEVLEELALGEFSGQYDDLADLIDLAEEYGLRVFLYASGSNSLVKQFEGMTWGPFPVIRMRQEPLNETRSRLIKRGVDLFIAFPSLVLFFWWFYLLMIILIKTSSKGPTIFVQHRIGRDGKPFKCYKFRTMQGRRTEHQAQNQITVVGDRRITWIGRILRATNLDELPQILNVLKGEMSIVGPRPHMVEEDEAISKLLNKYKIRRFVKPGITGWAAVNGYRGGTEDMTLMQCRVDHDIYYIENWMPWLDTKIIFLTLWKMVTFTTGGR